MKVEKKKFFGVNFIWDGDKGIVYGVNRKWEQLIREVIFIRAREGKFDALRKSIIGSLWIKVFLERG